MKIINDQRFSSTVYKIIFSTKLDQNINTRKVLAAMLKNKSMHYKNRAEIRQKLDELYGAHFNIEAITAGEIQSIVVSGNVINNEFTLNNNAQEFRNFIKSMIYEPLLNQQNFEECRYLILEELNRLEDDIPSYTIQLALEHTYPDSLLAIRRIGDKEIIQSLTLDDIKQEYQKMINEDIINVYIAGKDVDGDFIEERHQLPKSFLVHSIHPLTVNKVNKKSDQSYVTLIYNTGCEYNNYQEKANLALTTEIFGGSDSILFKELREKQSLCYVIFSQLLLLENVIIVHSGVKKENIELTVEEIKKQLHSIILNQFNHELVETAKKRIILSLKQTQDSLNQQIIVDYRSLLMNESLTLEEKISIIQNINVEDVINTAKKWTLQHIELVEGNDDATK